MKNEYKVCAFYDSSIQANKMIDKIYASSGSVKSAVVFRKQKSHGVIVDCPTKEDQCLVLDIMNNFYEDLKYGT